MIKKICMTVLALTGAVKVSAAELVLLPIRDIHHSRVNDSEQVVVTVEFNSCRFIYKGLYLELTNSSRAQAKYDVRALASARPNAICDNRNEPRSDSLTITPLSAERYEFTAVQPR